MIRTCDARFRKPTLYPLSYGAGGCVKNLVHNRVHNLVWIVTVGSFWCIVAVITGRSCLCWDLFPQE